MKRYDIRVKSLMKQAGIELLKYGGKSHSKISHEGIEVSQVSGQVFIDARGLYTKAEILEAINGEVEVTICDAKEETKEQLTENVIETLFTLQPVVDTPAESELSQYKNKPEYKIYPENVNSLDKVKEVVDIVLNDVLSEKHQQLLLDEIHDGYFKVTFNSRLRTSLGRCCETARYGKRHIRCIEFKPNYIKYEPDNNLKIDTIIHEICHAITDLETEESNMHGPKWQANCIKYGCSPTGDKIAHYKEVMWEKGLISHRLVCVDCDKVIKYVNNPSKSYINNVVHHYFYHKQCGGYHIILEANLVNNK